MEVFSVKTMHKFEELYWDEHSIDDIEANLFEPECILTDITKDEFSLYSLGDHSVETSIREIRLETASSCDFSIPPRLKDTLTIRPLSKTTLTSHDESVYCNSSNIYSESEASSMYFDNIEMHSIFTPDKHSKPKEIFTKCYVCAKYVIVRMCPDTGIYTKCKYCFNSPFSNVQDVIFENLNVLPTGIEPEVTVTSMDFKLPKDTQLTPITGGHSKSDGSFKCDHCGKLFTRNWYLKQHIKLHSNEKPFGCDLCDKRFLNSSNLKQHMKTHSVEYRCFICNKTYISQSLLNEHVKKHVDVEITKVSENLQLHRFQCNYCSQHFDEELRFKEHLKSHTKELPYHCDMCDKSFRYNNSLMKHRKLHDSEFDVALNLSKSKS